MVVQRAKVRRVWKPLIFTDEFTAVGSNLVFSQLCRVCRCAIIVDYAGVCFGMKGRWHSIPDKAAVNVKL